MKKEVNQDIISLHEKSFKKDNSQTIAEITKNMKAEDVKISKEIVRKYLKAKIWVKSTYWRPYFNSRAKGKET